MNLQELERLASAENSFDPVLADIMPEPMKELVEQAPAALAWAVTEIKNYQAREKILQGSLDHLNKIIERYAVEGAHLDPMFRKNLQLISDQIKRGQ